MSKKDPLIPSFKAIHLNDKKKPGDRVVRARSKPPDWAEEMLLKLLEIERLNSAKLIYLSYFLDGMIAGMRPSR